MKNPDIFTVLKSEHIIRKNYSIDVKLFFKKKLTCSIPLKSRSKIILKITPVILSIISSSTYVYILFK